MAERRQTGICFRSQIAALAIAGLAPFIISCESATDELPLTQVPAVSLRVGKPLDAAALLQGEPQLSADSDATVVKISPPLPAGLSFNAGNGRVSGTPEEPVPLSRHTITVALNHQPTGHYSVTLKVDDALPDAIDWLAANYDAEILVADAKMPVRMAAASDGRLFYAELQSGQVRVVHPEHGLLPEPVATVNIVTGNEKGLLGLALDPQFSTNGFIYLHATVPADTGYAVEHAEIIRYSVVDNRGVNPTVIVDNLPIADLHNGGDIVFDHKNHLFIGRGDVTEPLRSQITGDTAGKILRYTSEGGIPADNPLPGDPEWARGVRNTFALAVHPETGDLFGADAGPAENDYLNYLVAGKNFLWGMEDEPQGSSIGYSVRAWHEVITPTALLFHSGNGGFTNYRHQLFISSYNFENIRVIHLAGTAYTDYIREEIFATFNASDFDNKPLHMVESKDGSLLVSTFSAIYRITTND